MEPLLLDYIRSGVWGSGGVRSGEAAPADIEYSPVPNMQSHTYLQRVQNHVMDTLISGWATHGWLMASACIKLKRNIKTNNYSYSLDI